MPRVPLAGQSAREDATRQANSSRLVNLYREPTEAGMVLRAVPGLAAWSETGTSLMRDMVVVDDALYAVVGGNLWKFTASGSARDLGFVGFDDDASVSSNMGKVLATAAGDLSVWDGALTVTTVTPFSDVASVDYLGGYSVVSERGGRQFAWSALNDPTSWPGLHFATANIADEAIRKIMVVSDTLFIFGALSCERWALTGEADENAIARINGGEIDVGLASARAICRVPGGMAFAASNGTVCLWLGGLAVISTPAVNAALAAGTVQTLFYYEDRGHGFVAVTFSDRAAWVYDMAMREWHERAEGRDNPWRVRRAAKFNDVWRLGDDNGRVSVPSTLRQDLGQPLLRRAVSYRMNFDTMRALALVEAFPRKGMDLERPSAVAVVDPGAGDGIDIGGGPLLTTSEFDSGPAKVALRVSHDGGMTFGKLRLKDVGARGNYERRVTWRALGAMRSAVFELSTGSEDEVPMLAELNVELT